MEETPISTREDMVIGSFTTGTLAPSKPSIGRVVLYQHHGSADGKHPPVQSPALVQKVHDEDTVDLWVFGPHGFHKNNFTKFGDGPSQWSWPTRI